MSDHPEPANPDTFDYIVVGSGAGGAPLAARLVEAGYRVLVLEAGSNPEAPAPEREVSDVPALHAVASENPELSWQFFVKHYDNYPGDPDPKWHRPDAAAGEDATHEGIFYPRAAALGGCTIHNAMITVAGPDADWDDLADYIDDDSWRSQVMRPYFQRLERNQYLEPPPPLPAHWWGRAWDNLRWLAGFPPDYTGGRHGYEGWLRTSLADISLGIKDWQLIRMLKGALKQAEISGLDRLLVWADHFTHNRAKESLDPNHAWRQAHHPEGVIQIPLAVHGASQDGASAGHRSSPRELLLATEAAYPERLVIWTECLVTRVILSNEEPLHALGVEFLEGKHLYHAHPAALRNGAPGKPGRVMAGREVILCGGAFNTPQLLMLSGIGPGQHLADMGITCRQDLGGVGGNLHDRYEVTVVSEMEKDFMLLDQVDFGLPTPGASPDPALKRWRTDGSGLYSSNGSVLGILKRSREELAQPDLFIFGLPLSFKGYEIGYSQKPKHNFFTWAILKAHTQNRDGTVRLRSNDPRATPEINFHYFHETSWGPDARHDDPDLLALLEGVKFVNGIAKHAAPAVKQRSSPSMAEVPAIDDTHDEAIKAWIRREAWGHHACGSCRMGSKDDADAVLDSRCRVKGVTNLRVMDASIFPKIPGYFIVTNIYIASEKIADDIIREANSSASDSETYPGELRRREEEALRQRREKSQPAPEPVTTPEQQWSETVTGLSLSGGGVRSATLNLGLLQALAGSHLLRRIDFLSTVSGGGYIGSFLGRFFDRLRFDPLASAGRHSPQPAPDRVEHELTAPDSREIAWLRKQSNYLAPGGNGDTRFNLAVFLRNILSVHFVVGSLLLALFGLTNALRYLFFDPAGGLSGFALGANPESILPLGWLLSHALNVFWSPWFVVFELVLLFLVVPRITGYWIASQDEHERYHWPGLALLFLALIALLYLSVRAGLATQPLFLALSLATSFLAVELAWRRGRNREEAIGAGSKALQRARTRNYLTGDLGLALAIAGGMLAFAIVDALGHALQQVVAHNHAYTVAFTSFGAAIMVVMPFLRGGASMLAGMKKSGQPSTLGRIFKAQATAGLLALVLSTVPLVFYSFISHVTYKGGMALVAGLAATLLFCLVSAILANGAAVPFVNRSSLETVYSSHIARTYSGASNPLRHHPAGADVSEVIPGDDVDSICNYKPHESGGPLHLINVTVNQTVEFNSQRGNRDRQGENMAVSSLGLSIGQRWHAAWKEKASGPRACAIEPLATRKGLEHPLLDEQGQPAAAVEMLPLRDWIGISGAAIGPARGQSTALGTALLFGLANLRTGYWWDTGIFDSLRDGFPELSFLRRLLYLVPRVFVTQFLLIFEWVGRFPGPWERFWNLSDGGFFENLAAYELVRRRVPRMIVSDGGEDANYEFSDFANLVRKARIDFGASIEPLGSADFAVMNIPPAVQERLGSLADLRADVPVAGSLPVSRKHGALFKVTYEDGLCPYKSVLLYLKASVTGDEAADVATYRTLHPEFPHESTGDQFFQEAQWESYRKLGEQIGSQFFPETGADQDWFWSMPLP